MIKSKSTYSTFRISSLAAAILSGMVMSGSVIAQEAIMDSKLVSDEDDTEVIVVTSRKREEQLQDTPLAVTALDGSELQISGITDPSDLFARVPGLYFTYGGGATPSSDFRYISIRGVGFNGGLEPATGIFVDGMYSPQLAIDAAFLDAERIEILRGPQGTLFGRNTQAGAINIVSKKPDDEFRGAFQFGVAEFGTREALINLSGQLDDNLYASVAASYASTNGYIENAHTNASQAPSERLSARAVIRWTPTDAFEATLIGDISKEDYNEVDLGVPLLDEKYISYSDVTSDDSRNSDGVQLNLSYDFNEEISLTLITGNRSSDSFVSTDSDGIRTPAETVTIFPIPLGTPRISASVFPVVGLRHDQSIKQSYFSQELRLEGAHDFDEQQLDWILGAYYFDQSQEQDRDFDIGADVPFIPLLIRENFVDERDGYALFVQASYSPVKRLELTGGIRYSKENVDSYRDRLLTLDLGAFVPFEVNEETNDTSFDNVSVLASVSYDFNDDMLGYFTFSQGWKAGGINRYPSRSGFDLMFDDESSNNYELGLKSSFYNGKIVANLAAFFIEIEDQQLLTTIPDTSGGTPITAIANVGSSEVKGFEGEFAFSPTDDLHISLNVAYADTEFVDAERFGFVLDGKDFENVPELTSQQTITYFMNVGDRVDLELKASGLYIDSYEVQDGAFNAPGDAQLTVDDMYRVDLSAALITNSDWRLTFYVENVGDSFDYNYISRGPFTAQPFTDESLFVQPLNPRKFGLRVRKDF